MADINKVWMSGLVVTQPILTRISERTPLSTFTLQTNEQFRDKNGNMQIKPNLIKVESLGKSAESVIDKVKEGKRYNIDGYLRQDRYQDNDDVRVRTFAVYADESIENKSYLEGISQAMKILLNSHDLESAISKIRLIVENC